MDSLLTLSIGDYRMVDLTLRLTLFFIAGVALLLGLSTMCVGNRERIPLILGFVALLGAAWFESGIVTAWQRAFELAGSSYCVTGLPLAGEDRILAWAIGLPAILLCLGLSQLERSSKAFRNFCWSVLLLAVLGPLFHVLFLIGFVLCVFQLRKIILPTSSPPPMIPMANRIALLGMAVGILLTGTGHWSLLPLGKTAESILVRGELIRSVSDIFSLALPGAALLICILNLPGKGRPEISTNDDPGRPSTKIEDLEKITVLGKGTGRVRESRPRKVGSSGIDDLIEPRML
jgi:hypothetical protein